MSIFHWTPLFKGLQQEHLESEHNEGKTKHESQIEQYVGASISKLLQRLNDTLVHEFFIFILVEGEDPIINIYHELHEIKGDDWEKLRLE